ncbi:MAG: hypothetical protein R2796_06925 [Chitinophagaceae bacterium]
MEIFFDWELDEKVEQPIEDRKWIYDEIREFLKSRYRPLEERIDIAVSVAGLPVSAIVFVWHDNGDIELKPINIPSEYEQKVKECLSYEDMDFIMEKIGRRIDDTESNKN